MNTTHTTFAASCLRQATPLSRLCHGVPAANYPTLVYFLGCYTTWRAAQAATDVADPVTALQNVANAVAHGVDPLMTTLRMHAAHRPAPTSQLEPQDLEILSEAEWFAESSEPNPFMCAVQAVDPCLEFEEVASHLDGFAEGASGYWLLGRLEALTGLQAALAFARLSYQSPARQCADVRSAIAMQMQSVGEVLHQQPGLADLIPDPSQRNVERVCMEGLGEPTPRVIVLEGAARSAV